MQGEAVVQRILWLLIVAVIIAWIVLSYVPTSLVTLPTLAFGAQSRGLASLALVALVAFLAIQFWLVRSTLVAVRRYRPSADEPAPVRPGLRAELFWTALPIAMTVGVAWAGYGLWSRLLVP